MPQIIAKSNSEERVLHYPTLRTVILIENAIKELGTTTKTNLFRVLENRVMWGTMETVLDYLEARGMIAYDKEGKIVWVYNPKLIRKYMKRKDLEVKI